MLPDFPAVKRTAETMLVRYTQGEVLRISPVLAEVSRIRQHEGQRWGLDRKGEGPAQPYQRLESALTLARENMKTGGFQTVLEQYGKVAAEFAEAQSRDMFEKINEAVEEVGNVVDATGGLTKEKLLEMLDRVQTDFDPETGEPRGGMFVMHPDAAEKIMPLIEEWEKDPEFRKALEEQRERKYLEWRARESNKRLVD